MYCVSVPSLGVELIETSPQKQGCGGFVQEEPAAELETAVVGPLPVHQSSNRVGRTDGPSIS